MLLAVLLTLPLAVGAAPAPEVPPQPDAAGDWLHFGYVAAYTAYNADLRRLPARPPGPSPAGRAQPIADGTGCM